MSLVPKEILLSHLQRAEGAEEVTLPIDFFRDLLYQAMPRTCQDLIDEAVKAEREACAKYVEECSLPDAYSQECLPDIANEIRERGQA